MNKARRKTLERALELVTEAADLLETVSDEEQDAFDNLPAGIQEGERGDRMTEAVDTLCLATDALRDDVAVQIEEAAQ